MIPNLALRQMADKIALLTVAFVAVDTLYAVATQVWAVDAQSPGVIILAIAVYFFFQSPSQDVGAEEAIVEEMRCEKGWGVLPLALLCVWGGMMIAQILVIQVLSALAFVYITLKQITSAHTFGRLRFPLLFLLFIVPLPGVLVDSITQPLKILASIGAESLLGLIGVPVARDGVIIYAGQYQMLVADACAGVQTLFTMEALGIVYLKLRSSTSWARNAALAILIIPVGVVANTLRVVILVLITYNYGDEMGQGYLHSLAGLTLFLFGTILMVMVDAGLSIFLKNNSKPSQYVSGLKV